MPIVTDDEVLHGQPRIAGTRVGVLHVYEMVVGGAAPAEVADALDISIGRVYEALAYSTTTPTKCSRSGHERKALWRRSNAARWIHQSRHEIPRRRV